MKKFALGAAIAAMGVATQALPASADKLDDVLARLEAIEKNNAKLANENATLKARLNKVETTKPAPAAAAAASPAARAASTTATPTPPRALVEPEIDANGHGYLEHKKGNPLTFYTPGGEITGYGNFDISVDDTTKAFGGNINTNPLTTGGSEPIPLGNMGFMPAISTNSSYLGVRGFQRVPSLPFNFVYQLELGFDISVDARHEAEQQQSQQQRQRRHVQPQHLCRFCIARIRRHQDRQDERALRNLDRRLQSVRGRARRHACHHGQYRRRQPRRVRLTARPLDLVRIADDRRLPVQFPGLARSEPQRHQRQCRRGRIRLHRRQRSDQRWARADSV